MADDGTRGQELRKNNSTNAHGLGETSASVAAQLAHLLQLRPASGNLYFVANDGATGYELWKRRARPPAPCL